MQLLQFASLVFNEMKCGTVPDSHIERDTCRWKLVLLLLLISSAQKQRASMVSFLAQICEHLCVASPLAEVEPRLTWV